MHAKISVLSKKGGRSINEDYCSYKETNDFACYAVADGLGGYKGGDLASDLVVNSFLELILNKNSIEYQDIKDSIEETNRILVKAQKENLELHSSKSTLVALLTDFEHVNWVHVGDSRIYFFRGGDIYHQSKDHSVVQALADAGEITVDEIRFHEDRNKLLRAIGQNNDLKCTINENVVNLRSGDAFLLCTDGFWEYVDEDSMITLLSLATSPEEWLFKLECVLNERINDNNDNYTAMAVWFN
jgi:serine/threonine protein phosphatase PrpC